MIWRGRKRAASGQVGSHIRITFWPARKDEMNGPPKTDPVYLPHQGEPGPPARTPADPNAAMEGLQLYFLMRMQLKHCVELAKAMDEPSQDVKHLAGSMSRAAQRFADTALEFARLNGEK